MSIERSLETGHLISSAKVQPLNTHLSVISTTSVSEAIGSHYGTLPLSMAHRGRLGHWLCYEPFRSHCLATVHALCKMIWKTTKSENSFPISQLRNTFVPNTTILRRVLRTGITHTTTNSCIYPYVFLVYVVVVLNFLYLSVTSRNGLFKYSGPRPLPYLRAKERGTQTDIFKHESQKSTVCFSLVL